MTLERKYRYRRRLPHIQNVERPMFVSFNTKDWWVLPEAARDTVLERCLAEHKKTIFVEAAVVMPEHVHLAFWILRDRDDYPMSIPAVMKQIKGSSGYKVNRLLQRKGPVWQQESFDRILRIEEKLETTIEYIRQNPVRRGLVKRPEEYRWLWVSPEPFL